MFMYLFWLVESKLVIWKINIRLNLRCTLIKNRQYRHTGNIGHMGHRMMTNQRHRQHWAHGTQDEDKPETQATLGTWDTGWWQTKQKGQYRKLKRWATHISQKNRGWTQVLVNGKRRICTLQQWLMLITACWTMI
jgi:hypothetical protein